MRLVRRIAVEMGTYAAFPWWMGAVRYDICTRKYVVAAIPFNVLMRAAWLFWIWASRPFWESAVEERYAVARKELAWIDHKMMQEWGEYEDHIAMNNKTVIRFDGEKNYEARI